MLCSRTRGLGTAIVVALLLSGWACSRAGGGADPVGDHAAVPDPIEELAVQEDAGLQQAVLAGGCFWCTEAVFEQLDGVSQVVSGYAGGTEESADYEAVSGGRTEHAEAIRVTYDPKKISYGELLKVFFTVAHDPTQLNRQGPDTGTQYRSAVFYADDDQKRVAESYITQLEQAKVFSAPIVTTLEALDGFYEAEAYHQDFVRLNPRHPYVVQQALPKVAKVRDKFSEKVK